MLSRDALPRLQFSDLWKWEGTVSRGTYALVGLLGFALKHNLDRWLAQVVFGRPWGIFSYWVPLDEVARFSSLPQHDRIFLLAMAALSLPFLWIGLTMTLRRLRSAGLPVGLIVLFFFPFVNLLFFVVLAMLPGNEDRRARRDGRLAYILDGLMPESALGSAILAIVVTTAAGAFFTWLGVERLRTYAWSIFLAIPFCMGFTSALLYGYHERRSLLKCIAVAALSPVVLGAVTLAFAVEGLMCILMALPIGLPLTIVGGIFGYLVQRHPAHQAASPAVLSALILAMPLLMGMEAANPPAPVYYEVVSTVEVNAPPDAVWQRVISFPPLPAPNDWLFQTGVAYPMSAEMRGRGVGAVRHCVFSTGPFVEPIEIWDAPRRLKFSVIASPPPMEEWTPYGSIKTEHLNGFMISKGGQFHLVPLPGGRTRIEATTWYKHGLWPAPYWRLWSDWIIHRIHVRVLDHIKQLTEDGRE